MSAQADDPLPEARRLPTGRVARTARVGGLVTGQGLRWAGMRTANRVRTPERAAAAENERTRKTLFVTSLVTNLGFLFLFKYFDFFLAGAGAVAGLWGGTAPLRPFASICRKLLLLTSAASSCWRPCMAREPS